MMKLGRKIIIIFFFIVLTIHGVLYITGTQYVYKALVYNFADIDDYKIFNNRIIKASDTPEPWPLSSKYNALKTPDSLLAKLESLESIAFLIIKNDSIVHERYWDGYSDTSHSGSFSAAKSFISTLIGIAIREKKIKSEEQYVWEFLPEFMKGKKAKIKIKHLLMMSSGLNWDESYASPFSLTTEAYYGDDIPKLIYRLEAVETPGVYFDYKSGDTQILGLILEKATGMSVSEYAEKKLWKRIGAVHDAYWSLDRKDGHEKVYCCFNSNARDFARLGYLFLNKGRWGNDTIVSEDYVRKCTIPNLLKDKLDSTNRVNFYSYSWWTIPERNAFYARGILGQYIIVLPERNMVIVRLGKKRGKLRRRHYAEVFEMIDSAIQMDNQGWN